MLDIRTIPARIIELVTAAAVLACDSPPSGPAGAQQGGEEEDGPVTIAEAYVTDYDRDHNVDSPAIWRRGDGGWLFATAKVTDLVLVFDATDGSLRTSFGGEGKGRGQLDRPNGILVVDDLLFVVERNNRRVQVFSLPDLESLGTFGEDTLERPYGITALRKDSRAIDVYVTDQDERTNVDEELMLGSRVKQFHVVRQGDDIDATLVRAFGETSGKGVLHAVESIYADPVHDRLLIADEALDDYKVYTLDGRFTGTVVKPPFGKNVDAEGIALYQCGDDGYWILTEQHRKVNVFHVLDRKEFTYLGAFRGRVTRNTDGIALSQGTLGPLEGGAFFAVHDDGAVAAFAWDDIARALELPDDC